MLVVAYIGFGNSVCRYHLPYVERRKDTIKVKYIYRRMEDWYYVKISDNLNVRIICSSPLIT